MNEEQKKRQEDEVRRIVRLEMAYAKVFNEDDVDSKLVIDDLRDNCFVDFPSFNPDPYVTARNEGRREVWIHIQTRKKMKNAERQQQQKGA